MAQKTRQRLDAQIIAERTGKMADFLNCGETAKKAASIYTLRLYNEGSSGANAIDQGVKLAKRWKRLGVDEVKDNIIQFPQRKKSSFNC